MKKPPFGPDENPDSEVPASILNSCVLFCNVVIFGNDSAAALKYDEANMFAPMIVILEKDAAAEALVKAAGRLGVPAVKNIMLAKNLVSYGKTGEIIPETAYRDVSMILSRLGPERFKRPPRGIRNGPPVIPVKIKPPLQVELGAALFTLTGEEPGREKLLAEPLDAVRKKIIRLLGFTLPRVRIFLNPKLKRDEYRIRFKGLEAGRGSLELRWYAGRCADIPGSLYPDIMNLPENLRLAARAAALVVVRHASDIMRRRAPEFLGRDEVMAILDAAEEKYPVVTGEVKSLLPLGIIREIFQSLVSEEVSIRHLPVILETLADWGSLGPAPSEFIIDQIRLSLKRQICLEYTDERLTLRVLTLAPKLEQGFADHPTVPEPPAEALWSRDSLNEGGAASSVEDWADIFSGAVNVMEEKGFPPVILCSPRARATVKEATRRKLPELAVLSYLEIPPDISVVPMGEIQPGGNLKFPGKRQR